MLLASVILLFQGACYGPVPYTPLAIPGVSLVGHCPDGYEPRLGQDPPSDQLRLALYSWKTNHMVGVWQMHDKQPRDVPRYLCAVEHGTGKLGQCARLGEAFTLDTTFYDVVHVVCGQKTGRFTDYAYLRNAQGQLFSIPPLTATCWWRCQDLNQRLCAAFSLRRKL